MPKERRDEKLTKRLSEGFRAGLFGLAMNLLLFILKIVWAFKVHSSSVLADAMNNLSDFLSSSITLLGFYLASKPADYEHPFGHARFETISGFMISLIMLYLGLATLKDNVLSIFDPKTLQLQRGIFAVLFFSIGIKLIMYFYYQKKYQSTESELMNANAIDSINDVWMTLAIVLAIWVEKQGWFRLDLILGILLSFMIIFTSLQMIYQFIYDLLGSRPDDLLIEKIQSILEKEDEILGYHDLMLHSYGPEEYYGTVHVELDARYDLLEAHRIVDRLEYCIQKDTGVEIVIHLDPIDLEDPERKKMEEVFAEILTKIHPDLDYHDFRIIKKRILVDVVIPQKLSDISNHQLTEKIEEAFKEKSYHYRFTIIYDRNYLLEE